jgi:hypothetical protein
MIITVAGDCGERPGHLAPGAEEPCGLDHPGHAGPPPTRPLLLLGHYQVGRGQPFL